MSEHPPRTTARGRRIDVESTPTRVESTERLSSLRRFGRFIGLVGGGAVVCALLAVAVFPTRTFLDQRADTAEAEQRLEVLRDQNAAYEDRIERLQTPEEIERIAREQYNLVFPGEEAYAVLPAPLPELDLPDGLALRRDARTRPPPSNPSAPIGCAAMSCLRGPGGAGRGPEAVDRRRHLRGRPADPRARRGRCTSPTCGRPSPTPGSLSVEVDEARTRPGVVAVFTAADVDLADRPPGSPMFNAGDDPAVPGPGQGPLRRRARRRDPHRATRAGRRRRRAGVGRLRAAAGRRRPAEAATDEVAAARGGRHERRRRPGLRAHRRLLRRLRGGGHAGRA